MFVFFFFFIFFCRLFVNIPTPRPRALFSPLVTLVLAREFYFPRVTLDTCLLRKSHALFAKLKLPIAQLPTPQRRATSNSCDEKHIQVVFDKCTDLSFCHPISRSRAQASLVTCARLKSARFLLFSFFIFFLFFFSFLRNEDTPVTSLSEVTRGYTKNRSVLKDG